MIDFQNAKYLKMHEDSSIIPVISDLLLPDEAVIGAFKTVRDGVVFTDKRIIAVNVQGITGKKKDFSILPYSKIQAFSIETAGVFDIDSELDLFFSGLGKVHFEFTAGSNIIAIQRAISAYVLK